MQPSIMTKDKHSHHDLGQNKDEDHEKTKSSGRRMLIKSKSVAIMTKDKSGDHNRGRHKDKDQDNTKLTRRMLVNRSRDG